MAAGVLPVDLAQQNAIYSATGPSTGPAGADPMFIQTEATPNPATLKFLPGRIVLDGTLEMTSREQAAKSPLAEKLFDVPNVSGVFFGSDFITVTKSEGEWQQLKPIILGAIMEHYMSGAPLLQDGTDTTGASDEGEFFDAADEEPVKTIKELIETRVRPAVANDGGDITFRGFKDGVVFLSMKGACSGCPSSTATLKHGIQNLLRHFVPDVTEVRPV
jgi:Fe-S cluster biogenesis protein NfuA